MTDLRSYFPFDGTTVNLVTIMYATAKGTSKVISQIHRTQVEVKNICCRLSHQCMWSLTSGSPSSSSTLKKVEGKPDQLPFLLGSRQWSTPQNQIKSDMDFMLEGMVRRARPFPSVPHLVAWPGRVADARTINDGFWNISTEEKEHPLTTNGGIQVMNRNSRRPNKANKGARPCSRVSRRKKKEKIGKRKR
jgi:hypothetical protein